MLVEKQIDFAYCVGKLINFANSRGYGLTFGDAWDSDRDGGHMAESVHHIRLGVDLNLFVKDEQGDWTWVTRNSEAWQALGSFWKTLDVDARWGGDFRSGDYNHFSFRYGDRS